MIIFWSTEEVQYTNDILAMISPENEKVSLGRVRRRTLYIASYKTLNIVRNETVYATLCLASMFSAGSVFLEFREKSMQFLLNLNYQKLTQCFGFIIKTHIGTKSINLM